METADLTDDQIRTRLKLLTAEAQKRQVQVENWLPSVHPELTLAEQQKADKARNSKAERRLGRIYEGLVKEVGGYGWIYGFITASGVLESLSTWFRSWACFRRCTCPELCVENEGYRMFIVMCQQVALHVGVLGCHFNQGERRECFCSYVDLLTDSQVINWLSFLMAHV